MIDTIFLGSIGVLAETSDIQRRAYNAALAESSLDWQWDEPTYRRLLALSGGQDRLRMLADATGTTIDDDEIAAIHARKTEIACAEVRSSTIPLRPGVGELIASALDHDIRLGLVTSTYRPNIDAIADAAGDALPLDRFAVVTDTTSTERSKPAPDVYLHAVESIGADPSTTLAVEDTAASVLAAVGAGLTVVCTPGELSGGQTIVGAAAVLPDLGAGELRPEVRQILGR